MKRLAAIQNFPSSAVKTAPFGFDLEHGVVMLNNGIEMPVLGIGTYMLSNEQAENSVYWALQDGCRLIDTARIYGNEEGGRPWHSESDQRRTCDP